MPPRLFRRGPVVFFIFGSSAAGGAAYRIFKPSFAADSLNPHDFTPYTLIDKQRVSSTSAIFTLHHIQGAAVPESVREAWKRGLWSLEIKQPQLQIARAYTPLPPGPDASADECDDELEDIRLLIRQEAGGEVSTYLHRLPDMSTIELRGPHTEYELPEDVKEVIFLAGGTGIAPAMQVAHALRQRPGSRMSLLWANRRREECIGGIDDAISADEAQNQPRGWKSLFGFSEQPTVQSPVSDALARRPTEKGLIVQELEALKAQRKASSRGLEVQYFVDEEKTFIKPSDVATRIQSAAPDEGGTKLIFVSGPEGFLEYWAGKKVWTGGREVQGPLRGALSQMDLRGWKVYKL